MPTDKISNALNEAKLIASSMDHALKFWNYHTGQCIRTLQGHTDGVVILDIDLPILTSGSVDAAIKIWFSLYRMHYRELPTVPSLSNEGDVTQVNDLNKMAAV